MSKKLDLELEKKILEDIKKGESYNNTAKKHDVSYHMVTKTCKKHDVESKHLHLTDADIINALDKLNVAKISELLEHFGYSSAANLKRRLDILKIEGKINTTVIPVTRSRKKKNNLFSGYVNVLLYYLSKDNLEKWVISKIPTHMPQNFRKAVTRRLHDLGLNIDLEKKVEYVGISFTKEEYDKLLNKSKKEKTPLRHMIIKKCLGEKKK